MDISEKIKQARLKKKLTQKQLAALSEVAEITIRQYESGKRRPKIEQLKKIAAALNVPVSAFIDELSEAQHIQSTWEWIQDNEQKRKELIIEILKTHSYRVEETDRLHLTITDHQGFSFLVRRDEFQELVERSDRDIRYNIEKLLSESKEIKKDSPQN